MPSQAETKTCFLQVTCEIRCAGNTKAHKIAQNDTFVVYYAEYDNFFSTPGNGIQRKYSLTSQVKLSTAYPQHLRLMHKLPTDLSTAYNMNTIVLHGHNVRLFSYIANFWFFCIMYILQQTMMKVRK